jgi:hypothetical protein
MSTQRLCMARKQRGALTLRSPVKGTLDGHKLLVFRYAWRAASLCVNVSLVAA